MKQNKLQFGGIKLEKIGLIVDSGSDVPKEFIEKYEIEVLPLSVAFKDGQYLDGITIQPQEVFERMVDEIPKTSLPSGELIHQAFDNLIAKGCTHIIAVTISSNLSGTNNSVRLIAEEYEDIEFFLLDTKNIGIGSGLYMIAATKYLEMKNDFQTIKEKLQATVEDGNIFFHIPNLKYLIAGGRIGKVSGAVGNLLNIQPIITCDEEGIYTTVAKIRASRTNNEGKTIKKMVELMSAAGEGKENYLLAACGGSPEARQTASNLLDKLKESLPKFVDAYDVQLGSALAVHTGAGLTGCAILPLI